MSQTQLLNPDSAIWFVNGPTLFVLGLVLIALCLIFSMALAWSWATLRDDKRRFRESQAAYEQNLRDGKYLKLTPHGLASQDIELAYTITQPYHCLLCDRSFLMMTFHVYRLKQQPMSMFVFGSHYCKESPKHAPDEMRALADDFNRDELAYRNHLNSMHPVATQVMNRIENRTPREQRALLTDEMIDLAQITAW